MARYVFRLPDVGEGIAEAEIAQWHVAVGGEVQEDAPLVDVTTEKATVEITSPVSGRIVSLAGEPGQIVSIGTELVVLEVAGVVPQPAASPASAVAPVPLAERRQAPLQPVPPPEPAKPRPPRRLAAGDPSERPSASPAVRQRARDLGIELQFVAGSGPGGRITHEDLDAHAAGRGGRAAGPATARRDGVEEVKLIGVRRKIAERMAEAKRRIPHYSYVEEVDVTALEELRRHLNETRGEKPKLTILPFLMRALSVAVPDFPQINARFDDEAGVLHQHRALHLGIATQTPQGLLVPVIRHAEALDLWQAAAEVRRLSEAARGGQAKREELTGSTLTITSLGALGGIATTPVINHPETAIVGVNRVVERPMIRSGMVVPRLLMNLSSSFDHRVVDGYDAARFIQRVKGLLEQPATLFLA